MEGSEDLAREASGTLAASHLEHPKKSLGVILLNEYEYRAVEILGNGLHHGWFVLGQLNTNKSHLERRNLSLVLVEGLPSSDGLRQACKGIFLIND